MRPRICLLALLLIVSVLASSLIAEVPLLGPQELEKRATHIFVGKVQRLYDAPPERTGGYARTWKVAEISISSVEKGDGWNRGELVYARFWNQKWVAEADAPPGTSGHRSIPPVGSAVRVYLTRHKDNGMDVVLPNGFSRIPDDKGGR